MNRQARVVADDSKAWRDYGDIPLLEAARREAVRYCSVHCLSTSSIIPVEVRCEDTSTIAPAIFQVCVDLVATVLNPRLDTDCKEAAC
jgi:hypothetical protein